MQPPGTKDFIPTPPQRQAIHDLRNLFGIVAAAKQLLERGPIAARENALDALEDAAMRGGSLTTTLLSNAGHCALRPTDLGARLVDLAPMMNALASGRIELDLQVAWPHACARVDGAAFEATMLELISNAAAADARRIFVRSAKVGKRLWITVGDDGCGMSPAILETARRGLDGGNAHGTGIARVHDFVRSAHGQLRVRSRVGVGTAIALILPAVLSVAAGVHRTPRRCASPRQMEMNHEENRQPATA